MESFMMDDMANVPDGFHPLSEQTDDLTRLDAFDLSMAADNATASMDADQGDTSFSLVDSTTGPGDQPQSEPTLGGYYNGDGTYHYTSDNTDRDPETGAIVRRW